MANHTQADQNWKIGKQSNLDSVLDAALAQYAAVTPRTGLEGRILSNLRGARDQRELRSRWCWPAAAALATAIAVVPMFLPWESIPGPGKVTSQNVAPIVQTTGIAAHIEDDHGQRSKPKSRAHPASNRVRHPRETTPTLDQFPSPRPLSEQEQILASYVEQFREQATVVAQVRAEELQQERLVYLQNSANADSGN